jgi:hypothetical protein
MDKKFGYRLRSAINNVSVGKNMFIQGCIISVLMTVLICTNFWAIDTINNQLIETNQFNWLSDFFRISQLPD